MQAAKQPVKIIIFLQAEREPTWLGIQVSLVRQYHFEIAKMPSL